MTYSLETPVISIHVDDVRYGIEDYGLDIDRDIKITKAQMKEIARLTRTQLDGDEWWEVWSDALAHAIKEVLGQKEKNGQDI